MARRPSSKYVIVEASEDESDFSSEDLNEMPEVATTQRDWTSFTQELEQKYVGIDMEEEEYEEVTLEHGIKQSSLIPKNTSPRLFIVRVKRGSEREITMRIVHNEPKNVFSIVCKDGMKGYLYVEAFQKQHVIDALGSLRGVSRTKVSVVPQKEMIEALTYHEQEVYGEWGRIKKGKYKNDLVRILGSEGEMLEVRIVPRINGVRRLFNPDDFRDEEMVKSGECYIYRRDTYVDGFLEKDVLRNNVDFDVEPTFAELEEFQRPCPVKVGDKVRVTRGELIGIKGFVKSIDGAMATIDSNGERFDVSSSVLVKHFDVGEAVSFQGENGIIVNVDNRDCIVAIRDFSEEVKANIKDLKSPTPEKARVEKPVITKQKIKRDPFLNKEVKIQFGEGKGYNGVVKEVHKNICRVQLNSNMKFINVGKEFLSFIDRVPTSEGYHENTVYKTPGYKTPGYRTPGYRTPGYRTPGYRAPAAVQEEVGVEWLAEEEKPFKGVLIRVGSQELILEDYSNDLFITRDGTFAPEDVAFVLPQKNDLVCVVSGEKKGTSGILIAINNEFGVVRSNAGPVVHVPIDKMSRRMY